MADIKGPTGIKTTGTKTSGNSVSASRNKGQQGKLMSSTRNKGQQGSLMSGKVSTSVPSGDKNSMPHPIEGMPKIKIRRA